jgi:hypothetical protein
MNPLAKAYYVLRYLGPGFAFRRLRLTLRSQFGVTRRTFASRPWESIQLADILRPEIPAAIDEYVAHKKRTAPSFIFPLGCPPAMPHSLPSGEFERTPTLTERMQLLVQDRCVYFMHRPSPERIDWYHNPFDGTRGNRTGVWCDIEDFDWRQGDPRILWEPSRAAWAIDLARAQARGLDFPAEQMYWRWVDSWMQACPPFQGFQWKCGQESAVRFVALALAFWAFALSAETTGKRWLQFTRFAWATGYRISRHIAYAVSQNNNHALSEACGLLLISHLFPELREAQHWNQLGRRVFVNGIARQVYSDGSYIQHSVNYHRVMLHMAVLTVRIAECAGQPFDTDVYRCIGRAGDFLHRLTDAGTGRAPNYGHNDGAVVLPLTECDAGDFRPVTQSSHYLVHRERLLAPGPWDEEVLWLFGGEALAAPAPSKATPESAGFPVGGYYRLQCGASWAMVRCHDYRDRPGQCDSLHVDLWWGGLNVLRDCGTYQYYLPQRPELERYFSLRRAHNTVTVDSAETTRWVTRFLSVPFPRASCLRFDASAGAAMPRVFEGEEQDYARKPWRVVHRRGVIALSETAWLVVDDFLGRGEHALAVRWHLADFAYEALAGGLRLDTPRGPVGIHVCSASGSRVSLAVARGETTPGRIGGVAAPYYSTFAPIPTLTAELRHGLPERLVTTVGLGQVARGQREAVQDSIETWEIRQGTGGWSVELGRASSRGKPVYLGSRPLGAGGPPVVMQGNIAQ